jgi:hypothetical protein
LLHSVIFRSPCVVLRQALEHLAVGALERLPVLALRDHRVDGLEGLEEARVVVEDHVEAVDRLVVRLDLVAEQHRGGVVVPRLALAVGLDLDDAVDDADRVLPLLVLGVDVEQRVEERVVLRLEVEGARVRLRRLLPVAELLQVQLADLLVDVGLLLAVGHVDHGPLGLDHALPVVAPGCRSMTALSGLEVVRIHLERLLQVVEGLARLVLPLLDHAEAVVDEDRLLRALGLAVLDQDRLVQLERLLPVLLLEQQVGHADEHVAVGRVEVEGLPVVLEGPVGVAELAGHLGGAQEAGRAGPAR